ncbi:hypothetical protein ABEV36_11205 [Heyndrickxia faecalis]
MGNTAAAGLMCYDAVPNRDLAVYKHAELSRPIGPTGTGFL